MLTAVSFQRMGASKTDKTPSAEGKPCALPRRLAAVFYDGLLLIALWMAATALVVILFQGEVPARNIGFQIYLLVVSWGYFAICWRGGSTLGMKAWRITIISNQNTVGWSQTLIRFGVSILSWAAFGLGFLWSLGHPEKAAWHDLASGTRLLVKSR